MLPRFYLGGLLRFFVWLRVGTPNVNCGHFGSSVIHLCVQLCVAAIMEDLVPPAVHSHLLSLQSALESLIVSLQKITSGHRPPPASASKSAARNRRRQATLRKLWAASATQGDSNIAIHSNASQTSR